MEVLFLFLVRIHKYQAKIPQLILTTLNMTISILTNQHKQKIIQDNFDLLSTKQKHTMNLKKYFLMICNTLLIIMKDLK